MAAVLREEYGSAVAGRANSGRRGLAPGRIGAEESEERGARAVRPVDFAGGSDTFVSLNDDWADSGRGGKVLAGARRAFLCAAIASFRAERLGTVRVSLAK